MSWGSKILAAGIVYKVSKDKKPKTSWIELTITILCILVVLAFGIWAIFQ